MKTKLALAAVLLAGAAAPALAQQTALRPDQAEFRALCDIEHPNLLEVEINPLRVVPDGIVALDAVVRTAEVS